MIKNSKKNKPDRYTEKRHSIRKNIINIRTRNIQGIGPKNKMLYLSLQQSTQLININKTKTGEKAEIMGTTKRKSNKSNFFYTNIKYD